MNNKLWILLLVGLITVGITTPMTLAADNSGPNDIKVGNADTECTQFGYDFGIVKYEWSGQSYEIDEEEKEGYTTSMQGDDNQANWTSNPPAAGVLHKESTDFYEHAGGESGTVNKEDHDISHITLCGNEEPQPYCGDGIINQESEQCDGQAPYYYACNDNCELEVLCENVPEEAEFEYAEVIQSEFQLVSQLPIASVVVQPAIPEQCIEEEFEPVRPILECVLDTGDGYTAYFGYLNENQGQIEIPIGEENKFTPNPQDQGQPTIFETGRSDYYPNAEFSVDFDGSNTVWTLTGPNGQTRTATASSNGPVCTPICGNNIVEAGEDCDGSAPEGYTCTQSCELEQESTCEQALNAGLLTGEITGNKAVVTNNAEGEFTISLAIYEMTQANVEDQRLFDYVTTTISANQSLNLSVDAPICAYQIDLVCGEPKEPPFYTDEEKIDFDFENQQDWCPVLEENEDINAELSLAPYYPQENNYVFVCEEQGFEATSYDFVFGDGSQLLGIGNNNVYHTYQDDGEYEVTCTAKDDTQQASSSIDVQVGEDTPTIPEQEEPQEEQNESNATGQLQLLVKEPFPIQEDVVFVCEAEDFEPVSYDYFFGDGQAQFDRYSSDVYHIYPGAGEFTATCVAYNEEGQHLKTTTIVEIEVEELPELPEVPEIPETPEEGNETGNKTNACSPTLEQAQASCEGEITYDDLKYAPSGERTNCRHVVCEGEAGSVHAKACEKNDFFEVYQQESEGEMPQLCIGDACVSKYTGFAASNQYGICEELA